MKTHALQKNDDVGILKVHSSDNFADLFTKAWTTATFKKLVRFIRMCFLKDLDVCTHKGKSLRAALFFP